MEYNTTFLRMCRPMYKLGIALMRIGMVLSAIGLLVGLFGRGWMTFLIGIGCWAGSIIIGNIPTMYLASFIKLCDESLTAKQATEIVQSHLREPKNTSHDTEYFVQDILDGFERERRQHNNQQ